MHEALCLEPFDCRGQLLPVTCSLGIAWYRPGLDDSKSVIERADLALYAAKANGRNRVEAV
jgi:PleD family two-component response regulator